MDLSCNALGSGGAVPLAHCLARAGLTALDLTWNGLGALDGVALGQVRAASRNWSWLPPLQIQRLWYCRLLVFRLRCWPPLTITHEPIGEDGRR